MKQKTNKHETQKTNTKFDAVDWKIEKNKSKENLWHFDEFQSNYQHWMDFYAKLQSLCENHTLFCCEWEKIKWVMPKWNDERMFHVNKTHKSLLFNL